MSAQASASQPIPSSPIQPLTQAWTFDETTTGQDVVYTSPSAVQPNALRYTAGLNLHTFEVSVEAMGFSFGPVNLLSNVPSDLVTITHAMGGPAPLTVVSKSLSFPLPPEVLSVGADLTIGLDAGGHGVFSATNFALGTLDVTIPTLGTVTAQITSLRLAGALVASSSQFEGLGGDLAGSGPAPTLVGGGDLLGDDPMMLSVQGALPGSPAALAVGSSRVDLPFKGGVMVPVCDVIIDALTVNAFGGLDFTGTWPTGVPSDFQVFYQPGSPIWAARLASPPATVS